MHKNRFLSLSYRVVAYANTENFPSEKVMINTGMINDGAMLY